MQIAHVRTPRSFLAALLSAAALSVIAAPALAQDKSTWSATASVGVAMPVGAWRSDLTPDQEYRASLTRQRVGSRWALEVELATHPFEFTKPGLAAHNDESARGFIRQTSLGLSLRYAFAERSTVSTWLRGGVALHSVRTSLWGEGPASSPLFLRDEYVPGLSAGLGIALTRFRLQPVLDVRLRFVALQDRPLVTVPIAIGLRF